EGYDFRLNRLLLGFAPLIPPRKQHRCWPRYESARGGGPHDEAKRGDAVVGAIVHLIHQRRAIRSHRRFHQPSRSIIWSPKVTTQWPIACKPLQQPQAPQASDARLQHAGLYVENLTARK